MKFGTVFHTDGLLPTAKGDDKEPGQLSGISLGYGLEDRGFQSLQGFGIFLFDAMSRPALGPSQSPIQWVPGFFPGDKVAGA
jgi:hypothetical protein